MDLPSSVLSTKKKLQKTSLNLSINWKLDGFTNLIFIYFWNSVSSNFARKKNWLQICKSQRILVSLSGNSTLRITSKLKIDLGSPIFGVDKKNWGHHHLDSYIFVQWRQFLYKVASYIPYACHYNPLLIWNRSWFLTADFRLKNWRISLFRT